MEPPPAAGDAVSAHGGGGAPDHVEEERDPDSVSRGNPWADTPSGAADGGTTTGGDPDSVSRGITRDGPGMSRRHAKVEDKPEPDSVGRGIPRDGATGGATYPSSVGRGIPRDGRGTGCQHDLDSVNEVKPGGGRPAASTIHAWWADDQHNDSEWFTVEFLDDQDCILRCSIREDADSDMTDIDIGYDCVDGICGCVHVIAGSAAQLRPCRIFCELFLRGDTDPDWIYILRGVVFGFNVINPSCTSIYEAGHRRVRDPADRAIITDKLLSEIDRGCISIVDTAPKCTHDIFCVPKEGGGGRSIVDCSKPMDTSVNNYVDEVAVRFSYNSVDSVAEVMEAGDYLSTIDIKDAYRAVSIHPRDRDRQGLHWNFEPGVDSDCTYMKDNRLCMGLASSPYVFSKISDLIVRCAIREGVARAVNYLDDFCIISRGYDESCRDQGTVIAILRRFGFYISFGKIASPSTCTRFLGINIDSVALEMSLPVDKLNKLVQALEDTRDRKKLTRRDLERLGGYLAHCSKVVKGGRTFCRRIYDAMSTLREPHFRVRIDSGFREDIHWWYHFASRFNGKAKILGRFAAHLATYSDASNWGFGASHGHGWVAGSFHEADDKTLGRELGHHHLAPDPICEQAHINVREMWAAYSAALTWGHLWADTAVVMVTDSTTVRAALNSGRSKSKDIMFFLRRMFWIACENNFEFSSVYIKSNDNIVCDALSRLDDPGSAGRIRGVDVNQSMCCSHIFRDAIFSTCRGGGADEGEAGVPDPLICPELAQHQGYAG